MKTNLNFIFKCTVAVMVNFILVLAVHQNVFAKNKESIELTPIGSYRTRIFDEKATEISAYDLFTKRLFSVNANNATIDIIDISDPTNPVFIEAIDVTFYGKQANSVAVKRGVVAAAVEAKTKQKPGKVVFFNVYGRYLNDVDVGALPDMLTFTPNGKYVLVANEGEPNDEYTDDPEGSVSVIDIRRGVRRAKVRTADFQEYNGKEDELINAGVRIFGPDATAAQDLEPEFITISRNSRKAYVTLQENNAIAVIDIKRAEVIDIFSLGYKDHSLLRNAIDASDKDDAINIANWPVKGMYQPDAIASFTKCGMTYLVTANEGDERDYDPGFSEEVKVRDVDLDPTTFPNAATLKDKPNLGQLRITNTMTKIKIGKDEYFTELFSFGARSFSIWDAYGNLIFDSGDDFEQIIAADEDFADYFNSNYNDNEFDDRSPKKGPEPEGVVTAKIRGQNYAFIGLERIGGIMVYNVTNPYNPEFVQYINTRNFGGDPEEDTAGDLAPEGLLYIRKFFSPNKKDLLVVSFEVSGSITIFQIDHVQK
jgi:hypothetical protein